MLIIGCDFHPSFQMIAMLDTETGELSCRRLQHPGEAEQFYRSLAGRARVGIEAGGHSQWFQRLLQELGQELWVGDPARIRASYVRRQKTDRRDCQHILQLLQEGRFPRLWTPSLEERDVRQLLVHRHQRVRMRTQVKNQLQALALNQGVQRKRMLWSKAGREQLQALALLPYASQRRERLLASLDGLDTEIAALDQAVAAEAQRRPAAVGLMQQPGVGAQTALAFVLTIGPVERFASSKQVSSYLGLIPREHSSGGHQRLGHISKQGSPLLRFLLVEAAQSAVRLDPELRRAYVRCAMKQGRAKAKVAAARRLAVKLYWRLRNRGANAQR